MAPPPLHIAGAGIAGLTAALALSRRGFKVCIAERADRLAEVGAGLQLSPNASHVLEALGLGPALAKVMHRPARITLADGRSLATRAMLPAGIFAEQRWGAPYGVLHRADLQTILFDAVEADPACDLQFGRPVSPQDRTAAVTVFADGVWSDNRRSIPGAGRLVQTRHTAWRLTLPATALPAAVDPASVSAFLGPDNHLVAYPVRQGELINLVAITTGTMAERNWAGNAGHDGLQQAFRRWHPDVRRLLEATDEITCWPLHQVTDGAYHDGAARLLIGDAAHAMTPFAAQGAAMAIEDAWELAAALAIQGPDASAQSHRQALQHWQSARRARIARVRRRAALNRFAYHASGPFRLGRDLVLSRRSPQKLAADLDWLYGWRGTEL
ncbi:FAD-dependent monooxygenase [Pseudohoeflea coraliihabitans]|uniref:FAD-dependent monooxygenase n=1 Tax=Pseudohoeflea coraliihabitans TaxID=2860393 RepID=A0ABS6WQF5_9HYPH|nr:FAD-dependent monooxygenase [Pseudohoeflea sp. DP4N28-3]MBW3098199.1 FAD-dependent monooxygenase [Pseudohoeflea sp. DP4N28-3]